MKTEFWNNSIENYALTVGLGAVVGLLVWGALRFLAWRIQQVNRTRNLPVFLVAQALVAAKGSLLFLAGLASFGQRLVLPEQAYPWMQSALVFFLALQVMISMNRALTAWSDRFRPEDLADHGAQQTTMKMLLFFGRFLLFVIGTLVVIDNLPGVQITALVASLGIGGIAVALALQSILTDIFASLTITIDKPFVLGDFIIVGDHLGAVENIGLKTTRIRSLSGEQLVFSNNDLLTSRIRNFKKMKERRIAFTLQVTYDTRVEKLKAIPPKAKAIIEGLDDTRFDRAHFKLHGSHSLDFEIVYYVLGPDYNLYMDRQQAINLAIHEFFADEGIQFAFPTQTLHLKNDDSKTAQERQAMATM